MTQNDGLTVQDQETMPSSPQAEMMMTRQMQEVQAAMVAAKRFPRDELAAINRIKATCQRPTLAAQAVYRYPRGGQNVSGPSIRLAEALAQNWGNIDTGIVELENSHGTSTMMAYAWDLETNTRVTKIFTVEHKRDTKQGSKALTDGRDIYEATANFGARRQRRSDRRLWRQSRQAYQGSSRRLERLVHHQLSRARRQSLE